MLEKQEKYDRGESLQCIHRLWVWDYGAIRFACMTRQAEAVPALCPRSARASTRNEVRNTLTGADGAISYAYLLMAGMAAFVVTARQKPSPAAIATTSVSSLGTSW